MSTASKTKTNPRLAKDGVVLKRHQQTAHFEHELQYYLPENFAAPVTLAGMSYIGSKTSVHHDEYFDLDEILKAQRSSFRLRRKDNGEVEATFKRRPSKDRNGAKAVRFELNHPGGENFEPGNPSVAAMLAITCGQLPEYQFTIENTRTDHHYRDQQGNQAALSEDRVVYPDGSRDERLEVEMVQGDEALLGVCENELLENYELSPVKRGKLSEARKRSQA